MWGMLRSCEVSRGQVKCHFPRYDAGYTPDEKTPRLQTMWYIHAMECPSATKRWNVALYGNVDGPRGYYAK